MSSDNRWREVWSTRQAAGEVVPSLAALIAAAGWSTFGHVTEAAFLDYVDRMGRRLGVEPGDSMFEVGCGSGAFLYPWYERGHRVAGTDYSPVLAAMARSVMPEAEIRCGDAATVSGALTFDFVVASSVFQYFPDVNYAGVVLERMVRMAIKGVGVFDVPDSSSRAAAMVHRQAQLGVEQYRRRYEGLDHLFLPQAWFLDVAGRLGCTVEIEDQRIEGHAHNAHRFNVFIRRGIHRTGGAHR